MSKQVSGKTEILLERIEFIKADAQRTRRVMEFLLRGLNTPDGSKDGNPDEKTDLSTDQI